VVAKLELTSLQIIFYIFVHLQVYFLRRSFCTFYFVDLVFSVVDCVSHTLLAALAATQPGRQWGLKMQVVGGGGGSTRVVDPDPDPD
jgi:hypothetical protein